MSKRASVRPIAKPKRGRYLEVDVHSANDRNGYKHAKQNNKKTARVADNIRENALDAAFELVTAVCGRRVCREQIVGTFEKSAAAPLDRVADCLARLTEFVLIVKFDGRAGERRIAAEKTAANANRLQTIRGGDEDAEERGERDAHKHELLEHLCAHEIGAYNRRLFSSGGNDYCNTPTNSGFYRRRRGGGDSGGGGGGGGDGGGNGSGGGNGGTPIVACAACNAQSALAAAK